MSEECEDVGMLELAKGVLEGGGKVDSVEMVEVEKGVDIRQCGGCRKLRDRGKGGDGQRCAAAGSRKCRDWNVECGCGDDRRCRGI
eukprot:Seg4380.3 transcript_id=Seg4380.3/GoldUCD/mRNA.D3Y31 product="hypothetical protein" protein_id=Seg4380.3/GoldUCD/D3Y31